MKHIPLPDGLEFPSEVTSAMDTARRIQMQQGEIEALHRYLWCVARQQGGVLSVTDAEMAECPQRAVLVERREFGALRVAAQGESDQLPPRCPLCCEHGLTREGNWCLWCEDRDNGLGNIPDRADPQWLCPHGVGAGGPRAEDVAS